MACIAASSRPVASSTTARGLPAPGRSANTSTWTKGRWAMGCLGGFGAPRLPVHRSADHRVHRPAHPDLALAVDLQLQARIAADLAALAGQVAAIAPGQAPGAVQGGGDASVDAAGGRILGNAHAGREAAHHQVGAAVAGGEYRQLAL